MKKATLYIFDFIGYDGIMSKDIANMLEGMKEQSVTDLDVMINSPGGIVDEGIAIYNLLKEWNCKVYISGQAASIASVIAMAGEEVLIYNNSKVFIHNPWTIALGDSNLLAKTQTELEICKNSIIKSYADKTGMSEEELSELMDKETTLDAESAVKYGFADKIVDKVENKNYVAVYAQITDDKKTKPTKQTEDKMNEDLLKFFGLNKSASDDVINNKIASVKEELGLSGVSDISDLITEIQNIRLENQKLEKQLDDLIKKEETEKVNALIENAIAEGKILPVDKDVWVITAKHDFEDAKARLDKKEKDSVLPRKMVVGTSEIVDDKYEGRNVDEDQLALYRKAKEIEASENIPYTEAVKKAMKILSITK